MEPLFISGLYRSGTTLLNRIIDQSAEIRTTYDTIHYMRFAYKKYIPIEQNYKKLVHETKKRINQKWDLDFDDSQVIASIEIHEQITESVVYDSIMRVFLGIEEPIRWGEKTNVEWESIPKFLEMFPQGKAIHIYRDPRAVLASFKRMTIHEGRKYFDAVFSSLAMFNSIERDEVDHNEQVLLIKYEDLVVSPEEKIREICSFLKIRFTECMLNVSAFKDKFGRKFDTDSSFTSQKNRIDDSSLEIWKEFLSPVEIYFTEDILREKLINYGYKLYSKFLSKEEFGELYDILNDPFIRTRYEFLLKYGDGEQAYPDTIGKYISEM